MEREQKIKGSFGWLNATQFLGALNDNIFKLLIILFLIRVKGTDSASSVTAIAGAIFVVPFLLFSAFAGKLSDRFSKRNIVISVKIAEAVIMGLGCAAFWVGSEGLLYGILFLMAAQSAIFAPAKYGIVPELVRKDELSKANGMLEAFTYLAIIIGTALGPILAQVIGENYIVLGSICILVASIGLATSLKIEHTRAFGVEIKPNILFVKEIWQTLKEIRGNKDLMMAVVGSAYFLLIGGFIYTNLIPYGVSHLGLDEKQSVYLFLVTAVGIGVGSLLAGKLSGRNVEFGIVPLGAIGLTVSSVGLSFTTGMLIPTIVLVLIMGVSCGLFIVPIHAFIQFASPEKDRGRILAASGFLGWVGVLIASLTIYLFSVVLGMSAAKVFMLLGLMTLVPTIVTICLLPDFLVRFMAFVLAKTIYRIKVYGLENIPIEKGALIVSNHVSWVDALVLSATLQRRIRFIMDKGIYSNKWVKPISKLMKVIPISMTDPPKEIIRSLRQGREALDEGSIVCIFAEGAVTRNGLLRGFKGGFEKIMKGTECPIIPAYIGGAWGSVFSYYSGKMLSTLPKNLTCPISIHYGKPMAASSTTSQVREKVMELSCDHFDSLKNKQRSLTYKLVKVARKNWRRKSINDISGVKLSSGKMLAGTIALSEKIGKLTGDQENVGILLPSTAAGAMVNTAVSMLGKVSVNLNYTMSSEIRTSAIKQCGIECVISSKRFMKKAKLEDDMSRVVFIEDIAKTISGGDKLRAFLKARFMPMAMLLGKDKRRWGDDVATIIFSSGSSGSPKGVMLTHHSLISNIEAIRMVIRLSPTDNLCGVLPFFHSFGFCCSLWLPLLSGVPVSYAPNPIDAKAVGRNARENNSTILFAPPTFLQTYVRRVDAEDFKTLRLAVAGAEKLKARLVKSFEEKFGLYLFEGYGTTELSPVATLGVDDADVDGVYQVGHKDGSVGHPVPGVVARIVDLDSGEDAEEGKSGLLMIKGPNVMKGYLGMEEKTAEVLQDGWYNTGDIATMDGDGFITITDRLSRFSKIGGEMVPHIGIEEVYLHALDTDERVLAVTSVPDEKKGEELAVVYTEKAGDADRLYEIIDSADVANIWKPKRKNYFKVDELPLLGTGKLDIMGVKKKALDEMNNAS